jgi:DNA-binding IclR family transcriptional regulator
MSIPALERGLLIIEALIESQNELRFSDLKQILCGISDASLNRLLVSLLQSGHINKSVTGYSLNNRVKEWIGTLGREDSLERLYDRAVENLVDTLQESAGFCRLEEGRILVKASRSCPDSIGIIEPGGTLHFEEDHAASLALLSLLDDEKRLIALNSEYSFIQDEYIYREMLLRFKRGSVIADTSFRRVGISRIAIPVAVGQYPCALFICLPSAAVEQKLLEVEEKLNFWKRGIEQWNQQHS